MMVKIQNDVILTSLDKEIALLNQKNGRYFCLNETGARIWELLCETGDTQATIDVILQEYSIDEGILKRDMDNLLAQLKLAELLV